MGELPESLAHGDAAAEERGPPSDDTGTPKKVKLVVDRGSDSESDSGTPHKPLPRLSSCATCHSHSHSHSRSRSHAGKHEGGGGGGVKLPFVGYVKWSDVKAGAIEYLKDPVNVAMLVWILAVAVAGAVYFLVMTGMLNAVIPDPATRAVWGEVCNQTLNALFTLNCLLCQPLRIMYAIRLARWEPRDRRAMRELLLKGGAAAMVDPAGHKGGGGGGGESAEKGGDGKEDGGVGGKGGGGGGEGNAGGKKGKGKGQRKGIPNERFHMTVVVVLLNLNCAFQYALAGVNWGFPVATRPPIAVALLLCSALGCVVAAGLYCLLSPLGKAQAEPDGTPSLTTQASMLKRHHSTAGGLEASRSANTRSFNRQASEGYSGNGKDVEAGEEEEEEDEDYEKTAAAPLALARWSGGGEVDGDVQVITKEGEAEWVGSVLDCCQDPDVARSVVFCCCCTFGRNLESAGLGSRHLHAVMILLFFFAPFFICSLAALNFSSRAVQLILVFSGIALSVLGLLYGGYWRVQLRRTFRLPGYGFVLGFRSATDLALWLFCPWCALCQEVRTVEEQGLHLCTDPDALYELGKAASDRNAEAGGSGEGLEGGKEVEDGHEAPTIANGMTR